MRDGQLPEADRHVHDTRVRRTDSGQKASCYAVKEDRCTNLL
jgi:hypothetical protein